MKEAVCIRDPVHYKPHISSCDRIKKQEEARRMRKEADRKEKDNAELLEIKQSLLKNEDDDDDD